MSDEISLLPQDLVQRIRFFKGDIVNGHDKAYDETRNIVVDIEGLGLTPEQFVALRKVKTLTDRVKPDSENNMSDSGDNIFHLAARIGKFTIYFLSTTRGLLTSQQVFDILSETGEEGRSIFLHAARSTELDKYVSAIIEGYNLSKQSFKPLIMNDAKFKGNIFWGYSKDGKHAEFFKFCKDYGINAKESLFLMDGPNGKQMGSIFIARERYVKNLLEGFRILKPNPEEYIQLMAYINQLHIRQQFKKEGKPSFLNLMNFFAGYIEKVIESPRNRFEGEQKVLRDVLMAIETHDKNSDVYRSALGFVSRFRDQRCLSFGDRITLSFPSQSPLVDRDLRLPPPLRKRELVCLK
jgi:hypothetical protein